MKLNALILTSALMMTASMHAMQQETTPILSTPQTLPAGCIPAEGLVVHTQENLNHPALKFQQQKAALRSSYQCKERQKNCFYGIATLCCLPCLAVRASIEVCCPSQQSGTQQ